MKFWESEISIKTGKDGSISLHRDDRKMYVGLDIDDVILQSKLSILDMLMNNSINERTACISKMETTK